MNPRLTCWLLLLPSTLAYAQSGLQRVTPERAAAMWSETTTAAQHALKANRLDDAVTLAEAAITQARALEPHDTRLARSLVLRAEVCLWQKQPERAEALFQQAVTTCEAAVGPHSRELIHPLSSLANFYYFAVPHRERVAPLFVRILDIADHARDRDEHEVLLWSRNLGLLYAGEGDFARAQPLYDRAVALAEKIDPPYATHEMLGAAAFYREWRHFAAAERLATRALTARESALAAAPADVDRKLDVAVALDELGAIHLAASELDRAESACRRSLDLVTSFMSPDQPDLRPRIAALAHVYRAEAKYGLAIPQYQRLLALTEMNLGPSSPELATVLTEYASVLRAVNQPDDARHLETRARGITSNVAAAP